MVGLGFLFLASFGKIQLPSFHSHKPVPTSENAQDILDDQEIIDESVELQNNRNCKSILLLAHGVLFYFLTCGVDSYFQSQTYTFGLCGPLKMTAKVS